MPLYEYRCDRCGHTLELLRRPGEPEPALCGDDCALDVGDVGHGKLAKVLSVPGAYARAEGGAAAADPMCGSCGGVPGSCAFDN